MSRQRIPKCPECNHRSIDHFEHGCLVGWDPKYAPAQGCLCAQENFHVHAA